MEGTQQSELIAQRQNDQPPINFEEKGGMDMQAFA